MWIILLKLFSAEVVTFDNGTTVNDNMLLQSQYLMRKALSLVSFMVCLYYTLDISN